MATQADIDLIRILVSKGFNTTLAEAIVSNITEVINGSDSQLIRLLGTSLSELADEYPQGTGHLKQIPD